MSASGARSRRKRALLLVLATLAVMLFIGLCVWQIERRVWKLALIAAVDRRSHAIAVPAPPPPRWRGLTADKDAYRRIFAEGSLDDRQETLVTALTEAGGGYWVMTPLRTTSGLTVLVNRGFIPDALRAWSTRVHPARRIVRITGLLRISEPGGSFLRANDSAHGRWYSRDVAAIARERGLGPVAPYFIDADATPNPGGWPRGGMTVVAFANNHLVYAVTWFVLAALSCAAFVIIWRDKLAAPDA